MSIDEDLDDGLSYGRVESIIERQDEEIAALESKLTEERRIRQKLRSIVDRCHEAVGEAAESDDETLPEGILERVAAMRSARSAGTI